MKRFKARHTYLCLTLILSVFFITGCGSGGVETGHWLGGESETIRPTVTLTVPAAGATGVLTNTKISATFSEPMNPLTITTTTFTLMQGATAVSGTVAYSGVSAVFTPASVLAANTLYTATITTGATDLAGNQLSGNQAPWPAASNYVWSFTTGDAPDTTAPTVTLTVPANGATSVLTNTKISATFSEPMDPLTITTATFTLRQGATAVSGTVIYSGVTAVFTPASALAANTLYTATITTGATDLAGNQLSGNQAPWPAASNYVWSFTTGAAPDTIAPYVIFTIPANGATSVLTNTQISATFSEPMDPLTTTTATFTLRQGATAVSGTVIYSGVTAVFTPASILAANTTYTGTITTGAKDLAGNALASDYVWSFTTGAALDTTAPFVTFTVPTDGATGVLINTKISATFSEPMNPLTITTATFTLKQGATAVLGTVIYSGVTAVFTPASSLANSTTYTGTITTGAKDLAGNAMASNYVWNFTTGAAPDTTAPTVILTVPVNATTGVAINTKPTATFSEAMNPLTITNLTFNLKKGVTVIDGSVIYAGVTAVFTPLNPLEYSTIYTATVTAGAEDLAGNSLVVPAVGGLPKPNPWTFTTADAPLPPPPPASCLGPGPVDMGAAASFGVLVGPAGGATLTVTNPTSVTGDTGAASYVPAGGPSTVTGTKYTGVDVPYVNAKAAMLTAIGCASARACSAGGAFNFAAAHDFGGNALDPGVYCVTGGMSVGSHLTISNPGVYIFRSTGALTSANNINVAYGGAANAANTSIFWVPTGAASIGSGNHFLGTIMPAASAASTLGATTTLLGGRVFSNSDVNLDTNTIAIP